MDQITCAVARRRPWNKGKLVGERAPLKLREIWAIRIRLQLKERVRELAMFNLAIDSKLRSRDLVNSVFGTACNGDRPAARAIVMQQKTPRRCKSKSLNRPESRWPPGFARPGKVRGLSFSKPIAGIISYIDSTICPGLARLGSTDRIGYSKLESTVRYLGIEVDDALEMEEQTEV
jgi:hypothetical protein